MLERIGGFLRFWPAIFAMANVKDGNPPIQQPFGTNTEQSVRRYAGVHYLFNSYLFNSYLFNSMSRTDLDLNHQSDTGGVTNPACDPAATACFTYPKSPIGGGMLATDPYTPLLRAYEGVRAQTRVLVGAHLSARFFGKYGVNWLFEPAFGDSGYRTPPCMGISDHCEIHFSLPRASAKTEQTDYLHTQGSDASGLQNSHQIINCFDFTVAPNPKQAHNEYSPPHIGLPSFYATVWPPEDEMEEVPAQGVR